MKCIVTGGGGFLGKALALRLRALGHEVSSISRGDYPELRRKGIATFRADLGRDPASWNSFFAGAEAVFHTAAKVDMWGDYDEFVASNVLATKNVIENAKSNGVSRLIFTSSPSVVACGRDLEGVNEAFPYPESYEAHYPETKAAAERLALDANSDGFYTIALRPHLIWGPGDTNLIPTILERARRGRLLRIGNGRNLVDITYIDDCVQAHILALNALDENPACRGKAYFISQGEPVLLWQWIDEVLARYGLPPVKRSLPFPVAMAAATAIEFLWRSFVIRSEPPLTRFLVSEMATSHYFDISASRRDLGYYPARTVREAMNELSHTVVSYG